MPIFYGAGLLDADNNVSLFGKAPLQTMFCLNALRPNGDAHITSARPAGGAFCILEWQLVTGVSELETHSQRWNCRRKWWNLWAERKSARKRSARFYRTRCFWALHESWRAGNLGILEAVTSLNIKVLEPPTHPCGLLVCAGRVLADPGTGSLATVHWMKLFSEGLFTIIF